MRNEKEINDYTQTFDINITYTEFKSKVEDFIYPTIRPKEWYQSKYGGFKNRIRKQEQEEKNEK